MAWKLRARLFLLSVLFGLFVGCQAGQGRPPPERAQKITILFTNDLSGHINPDRNGKGGLARIATLVKEIKSENPNTILVDAGDASVGTAFTTETRGEAIYRVMNAVGYDASIFGNHEFDLGEAQARRYREIARFPLLACNLQDREGKPFSQEAALFKLGELRLAVVGIVNPQTTNLVDKSMVSGLKFLAPESEIRRMQNRLAGQADMLVLLSHQGLRGDISLAYQLSGIPLIIGGHSEVKIDGLRFENGVAIAQAGDNGWYLGRVDFSWDPALKKASGFSGKLIDIDESVAEDLEVRAAIDEEAKSLPPGLEKEIGRSFLTLNQVFLGYWMAELLKQEGDADFGVINTGGVRSEVYHGRITVADIYQVMPFNDRLAVFDIEGKDLLAAKRLRYFYFSRGPRIISGKSYRVASLDYLVRINDFPGAKNIQFRNDLLRDKMIERVKADRGFRRFWKR